EEKKPQEPVAQKPIARLSPEMLREGRVKAEDLLNKAAAAEFSVAPADLEDEEGDLARGKVRPGQVTGRDKRHQQRSERAKQRRDRGETELKGGRLLLAEDDQPQRVKQRLKVRRPLAPTQPRKGRVPIEIPITVRSLSEAVGLKSGELLLRLQSQG